MEPRITNPRVAEMMQTRLVGPSPAPARPDVGRAGGPDFQALLQDRLKVSGHAQTRLQSRNIDLQKEQWDRVMDGVDRAAAKGAKESLVLIDDVALVVSVRNRTVITAVDQASLKENVFTNIDSAVIV
ncbi:MAG: TIGR02530 family flagellar biosynthesis protein [Fimbriimonadaceae bacterium]